MCDSNVLFEVIIFRSQISNKLCAAATEKRAKKKSEIEIIDKKRTEQKWRIEFEKNAAHSVRMWAIVVVNRNQMKNK